ncbi:hypothetical protein OBBRIDRAFT_805544 [Obba rivulosa]|uniref:Zn(2)-C6 fungal-type domain-containing protein n=1 Tax=Obba rivulosa TaxID=1052685 RepID=A0A8E2APA9_9APHY|nr:hypothetical protein OBBRIDRAFT_805544 [Obba rivulosa]
MGMAMNPTWGAASSFDGTQGWYTSPTSSYATPTMGFSTASGYSHMADPSQSKDAMTGDNWKSLTILRPVCIEIPEYIEDGPAVATSSLQKPPMPNAASGASRGMFHIALPCPSRTEHPSAAEASLLLDENVRPIACRRVHVRHSMSLGYTVTVERAITFLESRNLMRPFTIAPIFRKKWLAELEEMLCQAFQYLNNSNAVAALFKRACNRCSDNKKECMRDQDDLCKNCKSGNHTCQTVREVKKTGPKGPRRPKDVTIQLPEAAIGSIGQATDDSAWCRAEVHVS